MDACARVESAATGGAKGEEEEEHSRRVWRAGERGASFSLARAVVGTISSLWRSVSLDSAMKRVVLGAIGRSLGNHKGSKLCNHKEASERQLLSQDAPSRAARLTSSAKRQVLSFFHIDVDT